MAEGKLKIAGREYNSRLIVGTGKFSTNELMVAAIEASGAEIVTVPVRKFNLADIGKGCFLDFIDREKYVILPNTAACFNAEQAVSACRDARDAGLPSMVKLEVLGDQKTLYPDNEETLKAAKILIDDGFTVLPYCSDDVIMCKKLEQLGCPVVMPLAAPIASGLGIRNPYNIKLILEAVSVPVIVDAGVGTASDTSFGMELGCDAILINTAIAGAKDPVAMAKAMRLATEAGRLAFEAGRIPKKLYATAPTAFTDLLS